MLQLEELSVRLLQQAAKIAELESRLNQNSRNSHQPPSRDGLKKKPALSKPKGKKPGGQKGHPGNTLKMVAQADVVVEHLPTVCSCGHSLAGVESFELASRQVFDLPEPKLEVTEHRTLACICPHCRSVQQGLFPDEVAASVQYGPGVRSLVVLLNNSCQLPFGKIRQLFADLFGYAINESTQVAANQQCYEALEETSAHIQQCLEASEVNHYDETGLRVAGRLHWLHTCSNEHFTHLFVHPKRGQQALDSEASILPQASGWAVHDCYASYFRYDHCRHAVCGAHLLRELQAWQEQGSRWAKRMHELLLYAYHRSDQGRGVVAKFDFIKRRFAHIAQMADREEPPPSQSPKRKRVKRTKGRNLLERMLLRQDAVLAFAQYAEVPFTNNQAERDIRRAKIKQKVAGCFRTFQGAQVYARIEGFLSTARKQQRPVFRELLDTFSGANFLLT